MCSRVNGRANGLAAKPQTIAFSLVVFSCDSLSCLLTVAVIPGGGGGAQTENTVTEGHQNNQPTVSLHALHRPHPHMKVISGEPQASLADGGRGSCLRVTG